MKSMELKKFGKGDTIESFISYSLKLKQKITREEFKKYLEINSWWIKSAKMPYQIKLNLIRGFYPENKIRDTEYYWEEYSKNEVSRESFINLQRIQNVCDELFEDVTKENFAIVKKISQRYPNISQKALKQLVEKYLNYQKDNSQEKLNPKKIVVEKTFDDIDNHIDYFIKKWILFCYSMSQGDHTIEKYIKFLKLAAKKSLEYDTSVRCDWENKKFIEVSEKPLNEIERAALKIFQKKDLPAEVLSKIKEICEWENPSYLSPLKKNQAELEVQQISIFQQLPQAEKVENIELKHFGKNDKVQDFVTYSLELKKAVSKEIFQEFLQLNKWWLKNATMPNQVKRNLIKGILPESEIKDTQYIPNKNKSWKD